MFSGVAGTNAARSAAERQAGDVSAARDRPCKDPATWPHCQLCCPAFPERFVVDQSYETVGEHTGGSSDARGWLQLTFLEMPAEPTCECGETRSRPATYMIGRHIEQQVPLLV